MRARAVLLVGAVAALVVGCSGTSQPADEGAAASPSPAAPPSAVAPLPTPEPTAAPPTATPTPEPTPAPTPTTAPLPAGVTPAPAWLGTRVLPRRPDGFGEVQPTPPELVDRRFTTEDLLPPPPDDAFRATTGPVPAGVAARSSWHPQCPVSLDDLAYVTVTFWGFDERPHTGDLLVNAAVADDVVEVFRRLHAARFPLEQVRVIRADEVDAPPTGDGNVTTAFVCRPTTGATSWSQHASGLAIDVNPFHNPYVRGDVVLPELASAYRDRDDHRPGMIQPGDAVTQAFADIGWGWGGDWHSLADWMHFSASGR